MPLEAPEMRTGVNSVQQASDSLPVLPSRREVLKTPAEPLLQRCWRRKAEAEGAQVEMRPTEGICERRVAERRVNMLASASWKIEMKIATAGHSITSPSHPDSVSTSDGTDIWATLGLGRLFPVLGLGLAPLIAGMLDLHRCGGGIVV